MSKQLDGIEQKDIIKRVTGKVTKLWEPKKFNGPKGEFEIQGGDIEIDGQVYGLKFFNNNQEQSLKNQIVTLSSVRSKHGLSGVTLDHESYSKQDGTKVDRDVIKVTGSGKVEVGEGGSTAEPTTAPVSRVSHSSVDSRQSIDKIVELHLYCDSLTRAAYAKRGFDEETLRSYVSSVFIEVNRKGLTLPEKAEVVPDPADWATAIVPSGSNKGKALGAVGKPALTKLYEYYLEKGFDSDFAKCVEQAGKDLQLDGPIESDVPLEQQDDIPW